MASVAAGPAFVPPFSIAARGAGRAGGVFGLPFDALFFEEHGLAAGADAIPVDFHHLDQHVFAKPGDVRNLSHAADVKLGDMHQRLDIGHDFDDRPDFEDLLDLAAVILAEVRPLIVVLNQLACSIASAVGAKMEMRPLSSISTEAPVADVIALMFLPPGPMIMRITSGLPKTSACCGAKRESSPRGAARALAISPSTCRRASLA